MVRGPGGTRHPACPGTPRELGAHHAGAQMSVMHTQQFLPTPAAVPLLLLLLGHAHDATSTESQRQDTGGRCSGQKAPYAPEG